MDSKIEQLTKKLYNEGVSKGIQESEDIIAKAKADAEKLINDAEKQAASIIEKAKNDAAEFAKNSKNELKMASQQIVSELKSQIENTVTIKTVNVAVQKSFTDTSFVKELMIEVVKRWDKQSIKLFVANEKSKEIESYIKSAVSKEFTGTVEIVGEEGLENGFKIMPKEGGYYINFNEKEFNDILKSYLRDSLNKLLFS